MMGIKEFLLSYLKSENYQPVRAEQLADFFGLAGAERISFYALLDELLEEEVIRMTKRGKVIAYPKKTKAGKKEKKKGQKETQESPTGGEAEQEGEIAGALDQAEEGAAAGPAEEAQVQEEFYISADMPRLQVEETSDQDQNGMADAEELKKAIPEDQTLSQQKQKKIDQPKKNEGRLQTNPRGFGFFLSDAPDMEDVFIPPDHLGKALHGDRVRIQIEKNDANKKDRRPIGRVMEVLERTTKKLVGRFQNRGDHGLVIPDQKAFFHPIWVDQKETMGAKENDKVLVAIDRYPANQEDPQGHVVMVIGPMDGKGVDISSVAINFGLPYQFSKEVKEEVDHLPTEVSAQERMGRKDLRSLYTVTIDGPDAKDFDDAISLEVRGRFYNLYVHIADVSHYVKAGSALDKAAFERGNSVYLLDRVIPMLPEALSNGLCSLNPGQDRLSMTTQITLDEAGRVVDYQFYPAVINSDHRLVYEDVSDYLEYGRTFSEDSALYLHLDQMRALYDLLHGQRMERGALDFEFPETRIVLDEAGVPVEVGPEERRVANRIIEEFMILNNVIVGRHFYDLDLPFIYRIHTQPELSAMDRLNQALYAFQYPIFESVPTPREIQDVLEQAKGTPEEDFLQLMVLTSMKKAIYSPNADQHFGLAADHYSHFTAPIRRYSDILAHRLLKSWLKGQPQTGEKIEAMLFDQCRHISETEQTAEDAEHDVVKMKTAEYMQQFVGDSFPGHVSGLTNFGVFIALTNTVEGLAHFRDMSDDYYTYDEEHFVVRGERSGRKIHYGDALEIQVVAARPEEREIDFKILGKHDAASTGLEEGLQEDQTPPSSKGAGRSEAPGKKPHHNRPHRTFSSRTGTGAGASHGGKLSKSFSSKAAASRRNAKPAAGSSAARPGRKHRSYRRKKGRA